MRNVNLSKEGKQQIKETPIINNINLQLMITKTKESIKKYQKLQSDRNKNVHKKNRIR